MKRSCVLLVLAIFALAGLTWPQDASNSGGTAAVPRMMRYSGILNVGKGALVKGIAGVTFALYKDQEGGSPLWLETQNVSLDAQGHFSVQLGATTSDGLPMDLFNSGEARWLGVQTDGQAEQTRVLLLSVPYALKAADAETIGGLPPSAFLLAPVTSVAGSSPAPTASSSTTLPSTSPATGNKPTKADVSGTGTQDFVPLWTDNNGTLGNSVIFQLGTGATAKVGVNIKNPLTTLDINGTTLVRGTLEPITKGTATSGRAFTSNPLDLEASSFNSSTQKAVMQHFEWEAEPTGNNTNNPGATLNLLFGQNNALPAESGLSISNAGALTVNSGITGLTTNTAGVTGQSSSTGHGVVGQANGSTGQGVRGESFGAALDGSGYGPDGVEGFSHSSVGVGVAGWNTDPAGVGVYANGGGYGVNAAGGAYGVYASGGTGVWGTSGADHGQGVFGYNANGVGVYGNSSTGNGVAAVSVNATGIYAYGFPAGNFQGKDGSTTEIGGAAVVGTGGHNDFGFGGDGGEFFGGTPNGAGLFVESGGSGTPAGYFFGDVFVFGNLSKSSGSFKIDHPLDPADKYLSHSFVESPDMMNIYNGIAVLDASGQATINLPDWFETLNRDFRYQLTSVGAPGPNLYVATKVHNNQFAIAGGSPGLEVSWQVTGIRQDPWANAHRIPVEEDKPSNERGFYVSPELYGAPAEKGLQWALRPALMTQVQERRPQGGVPALARGPIDPIPTGERNHQ